jgi:hypothetical protein
MQQPRNNILQPDQLRQNPSPVTLAQHKAALVSLGLYALAHGHAHMVLAITRLIQTGGMRHA